MAPQFGDADAEMFLAKVLEVNKLSPEENAKRQPDLNESFFPIVDKLDFDPEVLENPVVQGKRVGELLWKYTLRLDGNDRPVVEKGVKVLVTDCTGELDDILGRGPPRSPDRDRKRCLFWKTVREHYKD